MPDNLLANGNFEADWGTDKSHDVLVCRPGQSPSLEMRDNIFTPPGGWLTWFWHRPGDPSDPEIYDQPEVRDAHRQHDERRVRSGEKAILFFTFHRRHRGGFLQQVDVERGKRLRFTAWMHAWSNHNGDIADFPHPSDGRWSEGAGYDEIAWIAGSQPHDTKDSQQDARANFTFAVGIDPTGGTDPIADSVVWGEAFHIYNGYCKQLSVETVAQVDTVTVFTRSEALWIFKHSDSYIDDAELVYIDDAPPSPGGCAAPRTDYERTVVLLPPNYSVEWWQAAATGGHPQRYTISGSADDAGLGVGCLTNREVLAVNPNEWGDDLEAFFEAHYPGVSYTALNAATPAALEALLRGERPGWEQYLLWQCHPAWREARFGPAQCMMCKFGCYLTNLAMAQRIKSIDIQATPLTIDAALGDSGYAAGTCRPRWSEIEEQCDIAICGGTTAQAEAHLEAGGVAMIEVQPASYEHFVLATEALGGGDYVILDPYRNEVAKLLDHYSGVESWRILVAGEEPIPPPPPPPPPPPSRKTRGHIGLHLQTMVGGWEQYVHDLKPSVCKTTSSQEDIIGIKQACPDTTAIYRLVDNNYGGILDAPDPHVGARRWLAKFQDSLYRTVDRLRAEVPGLTEPLFYVESINEVYDSVAPHVERAANFDIAFLEELAALGLPVGGIVFTAGVGNPHHEGHQYELLLPLARKCIELGGYLGYHGYWYADVLEADWIWHGGRWTEMDKVFARHGVYPRWVLTESGVIRTAHDGWKSPTCYNGDWNRYLTDILRIDEMIADWNCDHDDRCLGLTLFTSGVGTGWPTFQLREDEMRDIAARLLERYR